ncbi:MAG: hypothetical protein IJJ74_06685 [Eubacterium sp.]|nr:hypothetical protein [Eubacterium sp.]
MDKFNKVVFKSTRKSRVILGIVFILLGLGIAAIGGRIFIGYMTASKELTKCAPGSVDNGYYKFTDVWTIVGQYGYDDNGTGYILWVTDETNPDNNFFMGMYFDEDDVDVAEKAVDAFWYAYDNYTQSTVYLSGAGRVRDMRSDEKEAFIDALDYMGATGDGYKSIYKTLEYKAFPRQMKFKDWIMIVIGIALFVGGIISIITMGGGKTKKNIEARVLGSGINPDQLASEITFGKKIGNIVLTPNVIFQGGFSPILIFLKDVIWCHGKITSTKNKAYGVVTVSTTKTYAVNFVDRNNKTTSFTVKNENEQNDLIESVHAQLPYIICGYNEDIAMAAQNNFRDLIAAVEHKKYELEHPEPKEQYLFNQVTEGDGPLPDKISFNPGSYNTAPAEAPVEAQRPLGFDNSGAPVDQYGTYGSLGESQQSSLGYGSSSAQNEGGQSLNIDIPGYDPSSLGDVSDYTNTNNYTDGIL